VVVNQLLEWKNKNQAYHHWTQFSRLDGGSGLSYNRSLFSISAAVS